MTRGLAVRGRGAFGAFCRVRFLWSLTPGLVATRLWSHISNVRFGARHVTPVFVALKMTTFFIWRKFRGFLMVRIAGLGHQT
jgi:hypothetical protein